MAYWLIAVSLHGKKEHGSTLVLKTETPEAPKTPDAQGTTETPEAPENKKTVSIVSVELLVFFDEILEVIDGVGK